AEGGAVWFHQIRLRHTARPQRVIRRPQLPPRRAVVHRRVQYCLASRFEPGAEGGGHVRVGGVVRHGHTPTLANPSPAFRSSRARIPPAIGSASSSIACSVSNCTRRGSIGTSKLYSRPFRANRTAAMVLHAAGSL